jgi:hypothetical protein
MEELRDIKNTYSETQGEPNRERESLSSTSNLQIFKLKFDRTVCITTLNIYK